MSRDIMTLESTGLKEFIDELGSLDENFTTIARKSLEAQQNVVMKQMRINWQTMVGGSTGGLVDSSFGQSTEIGTKEPYSVVGTVGVYHLDNVVASFTGGKKQDKRKIRKKKSKYAKKESYAQEEGTEKTKKERKPMNAPQIAYWVEFGTQRLKSGMRKLPGVDYSDEDLISVEPKPFMGNALHYTMDEQEEAFKAEFNRLADQYR